MNPFYRAIARRISEASERSFEIKSISHLGGGCINETVKLTGTDGTAWFLKSNTSADTTLFAAEFDGLKALAETYTVRVPQPLVFGEAEGQAWLAMEFLKLGNGRTEAGDQRASDVPLSRPSATRPSNQRFEGAHSLSPREARAGRESERGVSQNGIPPLPNPLLPPASESEGAEAESLPGDRAQCAPKVRQTEPQISSQEQLGRQLAELHRIPQPCFGWHRDNTIGSMPQRNPRSGDWITFWREHRLGFQLELAAQSGARFSGANQLLDQLDRLFEGYEPQPSLLHGDLWSGNVGYFADGSPVIFDPACYFGDREAEFGIIVMFGGFSKDFHRGYNAVWPLDEGFPRRLPLYELYHTLNHFNLFGGGYAGGCQRLINRLLLRR